MDRGVSFQDSHEADRARPPPIASGARMSPLSGQQVMAVDTETTGLSPAEGHALVEVATVTIDDVRAGRGLVEPGAAGRPIADAAAVHGITDAIVAEAPTAPWNRRRAQAPRAGCRRWCSTTAF